VLRSKDLMTGMNWISVGMNWNFYDEITYRMNEKAYEFSKKKTDLLQVYEERFRLMEDRKKKWAKHAANAPSLYYYQKKYIYHEE
jgi:stress response protein YsnF